MQTAPQKFYNLDDIQGAVQDALQKAGGAGQAVDYVTFVPDGEPTLDVLLGTEIEQLKRLNVSVAVITNASLIWRRDVREKLLNADWVSIKVDAVAEAVWRQINRPCGSLRLTEILGGVRRFAEEYRGRLVTETMLVAGVNDNARQVLETARFVGRLNPDAAYISIPTRPPSEKWVRGPAPQALNRAFQLFGEHAARVEYLIGYEGNAFAFTGDASQDLLSITAVHPMRRDAVQDFLKRAGAEWTLVENLITTGQLIETEYGAHTFYLRKLRLPHRSAHRGGVENI